MLNLAVNQRAQYLDNNGDPLSVGRVTYYDVNTTTLKSIYADPNSVTELTNPLILDIGGFVPVSGVFYGEGNYTILVEKCVNPESPIGERIYDEEYTIPDVPGTIISDVVSNSTTFINAVEDIPNLIPGEYIWVYCQQYYNSTTRDSGGGWFRWFPSSSASPDLGSIFSTTGSPSIGRYIRQYPNAIVKTSYYGVVGGRNASMVSRIQSAATYATSNKFSLEFSTGYIQTSGDFTINAGNVIIEDGFRLVRLDQLFATAMTLNCTSIDVQTSTKFINEAGEPFGPTNIIINSDSQFDVSPIWWGGDNTGTQDAWGALLNASISANLSKSPIVIDGTYVASATGSFAQPEATFNNLVFKQGAYIQTTYPKIIINQIDKYPTDSFVIRTPDDTIIQYLGTVNGSVDASWVFPTTMTAGLYYRVLKDLQDVNTKPVHVYWESPRGQGWAITGAMEDDATAKLTYHYFSNGNFVRLGANSIGVASFGRIRTLTDCLETGYYAPKMFNGDEFNMKWWGVDELTSASTVAIVLNKSIRAAVNANDVYGSLGTLNLNGLTLTSGNIGSLSLPNGNIKITNGSIFSTTKIATITDANTLVLDNVTIAIDANDCVIISYNNVIGEYYSNTCTISGEEVSINNSTITSLSQVTLSASSFINVRDNKFVIKNKLLVNMQPLSSFTDNTVSITETKLIEFYRHIEFNNVSGCNITNNKFKAGIASGSSVPTSNLAFIWITGSGSGNYVRGFSMFGNQMIDETSPQSAVPGYAYTWLRDMCWITQADLAIDGHIADVYDNYGNIYVAPDANGSSINAQLIPGTRCIIPRIYYNVDATFYFILPKSIAPQPDPNFAYVRPVKLCSGPNTTWGGATMIPASVQPPTTLTPPFTAKIKNLNNNYPINAEVWVSSGSGNQLYVA